MKNKNILFIIKFLNRLGTIPLWFIYFCLFPFYLGISILIWLFFGDWILKILIQTGFELLKEMSKINIK